MRVLNLALKEYKERIKILNDWFSINIKNSDKVKLIDKIFVNLDNDDKEVFKNFNNQAIIDGYEGIMIKDPESFYECKRSTTWLKLKPVIEIS